MAEVAAKAELTEIQLKQIENQSVQPEDVDLSMFHRLFPVELARWCREPNSGL